ncbi:MAG: formyltransferase family protein [Chloroflexota bacterium]|nr:formyltransferase family protein [Chloroflexota bacterium]
MLNIGWFSTGRDEAACQILQTVQESIEAGKIQGKISFVFSNREQGEAKESDTLFELVRRYDIPLVCFSYRKFMTPTPTLSLEGRGLGASEVRQSQDDWRLRYDREVNKRIKKYCPDICVLAGYMLIIGKELCQKYNMINLHPAPPNGPTGTWEEVIQILIRDKSKEAGAMMHMVTPELDRGPVVSYCTFPIIGTYFDVHWQGDDQEILFRLIREYELAREFPLIILTLQALSRGEISIKHGKVIDAKGESIKGYNFSSKIDQVVEGKIGKCH